jgi:hypothetical protein
LNRRVGAHIPEQIAGACRLGADDAQRRASGEGTDRAQSAAGDSDLGAARQHGLQSLAAALGVKNIQFQIVFAENPGALAEFRHRRIPVAFLPDRELQTVGGSGAATERQRRGRQQRTSK